MLPVRIHSCDARGSQEAHLTLEWGGIAHRVFVEGPLLRCPIDSAVAESLRSLARCPATPTSGPSGLTGLGFRDQPPGTR